MTAPARQGPLSANDVACQIASALEYCADLPGAPEVTAPSRYPGYGQLTIELNGHGYSVTVTELTRFDRTTTSPR